MTTPKLKPCPFCGGEANFEQVDNAGYNAWTVGCANFDVDCIATLMVATFARQKDAVEAWNKRAPISDVPTLSRI